MIPENYYLIPNEVYGDSLGYEFLAYLSGSSLNFVRTVVVVDFEQCIFFEGNLCAVLGSIFQSLKDRGNKIDIINLTGNLRGALSRSGFLQEFIDDFTTPIVEDSTVPFRRFNQFDEDVAKDFFKLQLFDKPKMPKMSILAQKQIIQSIFEVCVNGFTHGGCESVFCCGQVFYRQNPPKAIISIVDLGKTIKANVNAHLQKMNSGSECILWALKEGNTTKTGTTPGGLGLKQLQDLITLNKGKLQIVSADGFLEVKDNNQSMNLINIDFPGTIVTLELLLNDKNFYILQTEKDTDEEIEF